MFRKLTDKNEGSNSGFTLAELLIVVAIAIPMFLNNLRSMQQRVDLSNARSALSIATSNCLRLEKNS